MKPRILLLQTGGTIGMTPEGRPDEPAAFARRLRAKLPGLDELAEVHVESVMNKDSSDILPADWVALATRLFAARDDWDGFVVAHGTDTMAFTASALSFMLAGFPKPIIFTGSQRPLGDPLSDAARNLLYAVSFASRAELRGEIAIFFDHVLLRGNRAKKASAGRFDAFVSPNFPPLATVGVRTEFAHEPLRPQVTCAPTLDARVEPRVLSLTLFPGIDLELCRPLLREGLQGVLLSAFGAGNIPLGNPRIPEFIRLLTQDGIPTVITSQTFQGAVDLSIYETGRAARDAGAIGAGDLTWEAALTKMMTLLGRGLRREEFQTEFTRNLAGELTP